MRTLLIVILAAIALALQATQPAQANWLTRVLGIEQPGPDGCPPPPTAKK